MYVKCSLLGAGRTSPHKSRGVVLCATVGIKREKKKLPCYFVDRERAYYYQNKGGRLASWCFCLIMFNNTAKRKKSNTHNNRSARKVAQHTCLVYSLAVFWNLAWSVEYISAMSVIKGSSGLGCSKSITNDFSTVIRRERVDDTIKKNRVSICSCLGDYIHTRTLDLVLLASHMQREVYLPWKVIVGVRTLADGCCWLPLIVL